MLQNSKSQFWWGPILWAQLRFSTSEETVLRAFDLFKFSIRVSCSCWNLRPRGITEKSELRAACSGVMSGEKQRKTVPLAVREREWNKAFLKRISANYWACAALHLVGVAKQQKSIWRALVLWAQIRFCEFSRFSQISLKCHKHFENSAR